MKEGETDESSGSKAKADVEPESSMAPRSYQEELLERAKERNTIVCLGTGTGKTFISVMLIKEMAYQVRETYKNGGKRTFFLVNTVALAIQQAKVIDEHTDLKVKYYVGEMNVDFWDKSKWEKEFIENNVLVMTAEIFRNLLIHCYIQLSQVNLLIFDECHHAKKNHPYRQIMQAFNSKGADLPKILGLTASVVNEKVRDFENLESEIQELECTLQSTCETSQDEEVARFAAKPREEVLPYSNDDMMDDSHVLIQNLQDVLAPGLKFLEDCRVSRKGPLRNAVRCAKSALMECQETLRGLGPWACNRVAGYLIKDLERACMFQVSDLKEQHFLEFSATKLRELQSEYQNLTSPCTGSTDVDSSGHSFITPKLQKLLSVLKEDRNSKYETDQAHKLCGIVFVERRYTALVLSEQINIVAEHDPELTFVKSKFVIGHGTGGKVNYSNEAGLNYKKQEEVLRQFRRHKFNLLIATCVVEEGLDIPKCNVVCRFDFPKTFRSYVQSKGRARAKDSSYYILVDRDEQVEKKNELAIMHDIEDYLSEMCHDRTKPTKEECDEAVNTDLLPPYIPENGRGARLTMNYSIPLLFRYCAKLPGDRFTQPKPVFKVEEIGTNGYRCQLEMPTNCQLRRAIIGLPMPRKNLARMAAAYKACKELHRIRELDGDLLPVRSLSDEESESEEGNAESGEGKKTKEGTKKRKQIYERKVPKAFIDSLAHCKQPQYLTVISIRIVKLTNQKDLDVSKRCFTDDCCNMFGLLTNSPLPAVRPFKLYPDYGEVTVSLTHHTSPLPTKLTEIHLATVQKFHCFLFSHILGKPVELKAKHGGGNGDGYFIVLVKNTGCELDYQGMKDAYERCVTIGEDIVVTKNYVDPQQRRQRFAVLNVRRDLSPLSPFPDQSKAKSYESYFWQRYNKRITIQDQSLIEVRDISGRVNFLSDRKPTSKIKHAVIHLVPELCEVVPVRSSILSVALMLPSILHRVNALLLVSDVKRMITGVSDNTDESKLPPIGVQGDNDEKSLLRIQKSSATAKMSIDDAENDDDDNDDDNENDNENDDGDDDGDNDDNDLKEIPELISDLKYLFHGNCEPGDPDSALVLKALTTTHSGDPFDLERLEILGDAFLKLAVSLHLFWTYKEKDEGKLTRRKDSQISNLALFRAALKKSLAGYQQCTQLAHDNWCPTGWQISEIPPEAIAGSGDKPMEIDDSTSGTADEEMEVDVAGGGGSAGADIKAVKYNTQEIVDKSIADSMEALIGAYLISCGYLGALRFMKFLGIKVLPKNFDDYDLGRYAENCKAGCYARFWSCGSDETEARDIGDTVSSMLSGLENFERDSIHYTFRSKLYLLEALTHSSYHVNRVTPCYQRLEFLGDAILEFLVTQHLYFRHAKLSPGDLTDIRQALLNNNIFATISVKYKYNKYLKQMSPMWFKTIKDFITKVEDETEERGQDHVTADPFIIVSEQNEEGFEAPKVLADIFESVAGAVFLDSGMDLATTWGVYYRMMRPYIDHYSVHIPINPIRRVHEEDNKCNFSKAIPLSNGKIERTLKVRWGEFVGKGANKKSAKTTAAKLAVQALERSMDEPSK